MRSFFIAALLPLAAVAAEPRGIYVVNDYANNTAVDNAYPPGLFTAPAYIHDVNGHAIFVPLAQLLPKSVPSNLTWAQLFDAANPQIAFDWTYLDTLAAQAVSHQKKFSIALVVGLQLTSANFQASLPDWFDTTCNPAFDPSNPNTPTSCAPTFNVYDEEVRMPVVPPGSPLVPSGEGYCTQGDGRYYSSDLTLSNNSIATDASQTNYTNLGYAEYPASFIFPSTSAETGFLEIAKSFATAFPNRMLGLSLFNPSIYGDDFPNFNGYFGLNQMMLDIALFVVSDAPGRVLLQSDDLGSSLLAKTNYIPPQVLNDASTIYQGEPSFGLPQLPVFSGWQTNHHNSGSVSGANCMGVDCTNDTGPNSYFQLMKDGWEDPSGTAYGTTYLEVSRRRDRLSEELSRGEEAWLLPRALNQPSGGGVHGFFKQIGGCGCAQTGSIGQGQPDSSGPRPWQFG